MRDPNNPNFTTKLFMHTLCMTSLIIFIVSTQTIASKPPSVQKPEPPSEPEFPQVQPPESRIQSPESHVQSPESRVQSPEYRVQHRYDEVLDYSGGWDDPPYTGGRASAGPIPHAELDDDMASDEIDLLD